MYKSVIISICETENVMSAKYKCSQQFSIVVFINWINPIAKSSLSLLKTRLCLALSKTTAAIFIHGFVGVTEGDTTLKLTTVRGHELRALGSWGRVRDGVAQ